MQPNQTGIYEVEVTGGAHIGWAKASWPLAKLTVTRDKLQLNAGIIGKLVFKPKDIISIETYSTGLTGGVKINHNVPGYKSLAVFTTNSNSNDLINSIRQSGFLTNKDPLPAQTEEEINTLQASGSFPVKTQAAIAIVVIWNLCFLPTVYQVFFKGLPGVGFDIGIRAALGFLLSLALALLFVRPVQKLVLKPGRTAKDIRSFLFFLIFIGSVMLVFSLLIPRLMK